MRECAGSELCAGMCMYCGCNKAVLSQHTDIIDETPIITSTKQTKQPRCYAKKLWVPYGDMCIKPPKYRDFLICTFLLFHNKTKHVHVAHNTHVAKNERNSPCFGEFHKKLYITMKRQKTLHNYTRGKLLYITMEPLGSMLTNPLILLDFYFEQIYFT